MDILYTQYDEVQLRLECLVDDINLQVPERNEFESLYYKHLAKAQDILTRNMHNIDSDKASLSRASNHKLVKLPTIQLPKFSGSYDNWLEFHDTFSSLIHSNDEIDDINKFHYLRASLEGTAAVVIQSIEFSALNYSVAWNLLCERFDNKRLLIQNHVTALFNLEAITKESSVSIKRMIDQFNKNLRALESLGEPTQKWDTLLIHIITHKLDSKTFREWEEFKGRLSKDMAITLIVFLEFMRNRADLLETLEMSRGLQVVQSVKGNKFKAMVSVANTNVQSESGFDGNNNSKLNKLCPKCNADHPLYNCSQFLSLTNEQRLELLPKYKICYNCFRSGHYANNCKKYGCKVCKRKHNTLIHISEPKRSVISATSGPEDGGVKPTVPHSENRSLTHLTLSTCIDKSLENEPDTLLSTALIKVYDGNNREHVVRVLLDSGSTSCLMTEKMCQTLNLPIDHIDKPIFGLNNSKSHTTKMCRMIITSLSEHFTTNINCFVLPAITDTVPSRQLDISNINIPNDIVLADPNFYLPSEVDLVIGANVFWDLLGVQRIILGDGKPKLWESRLGWLVCGTLGSVYTAHRSNTLLCNFTKIDSTDNDLLNDDVQNLLTRFWQLEEVGPKSSYYSEEEKLCEEHFVKNTVRLQDGRFCVRVPLKQSPDKLGNSFERARRCFFSLERKFKAQPSFKKRYVDFMSEYILLGHMSECTSLPGSNPYYIPHHGVIRESSSTTKLRVVFNASSPTTSGLSSNNIQMVGPTVQDDLLAILIRFRQHKYVLVGDVEKMYRQVVVHPDDRFLQQILWRNDASEPLKVYQLNTVTYGTASAPFLATRCLKQISLDCKDDKIAEIIEHSFYVDDVICSGDTVAEVIDIRQKLTAALGSAGMPLRKWKSNEPHIISDNSESSTLDLNIGANGPSKTLGLGWHTESDKLYFVVDPDISNNLTKRGMLSVIAQIFDPLGLLAPGIISLKILLQKMWLLKLSWDEQLPSDVAKRWCELIKNLPILNNLRIPRPVICDSKNFVDIHVFSDASQCAFGACVYVRNINTNGDITVRLLLAKSRVAPIKPTTIPRLELCAALTGVRLYEKVVSSLRVKVRHTVFWTDSTIVLGWLKMLPSKLQPFVRNRVAEILEKTVDCDWRHVPTDENPADHISRGVDFSLIPALDIWWSGPSFLQRDKSHWPPNPLTMVSLPEVRTEVSLHASLGSQNGKFIDFERFSNLNRLQRTVAFVLRFIRICKKQPVKTDFLHKDELQDALNVILRISQSETFPEYKLLLNKQDLNTKSPLLKFNVFLDENNLMRVGGRLVNSTFSYDKKHPILIQSTHRLAKLLFDSEHIRLMHAGPQLMLASIRESYWPIGGRNLARLCYHKCVRCNRMKGKTVTPIMGNLPSSRLVPGGYPFERVGVDYAGPILSASRQGRGSRLVKVYIAIFVCFTTKAIHIELVGDLTSNSFLLALRRFISRRGKPRDIYSDNGTSFVGASNEIGKFLKNSCSSLPETVANDGINFHFIPPYSPHFGGLWEAGVKSIKFHLHRVLGNCHLVYEELNTVLVQIEAVLNSRPITPMSPDPNDLQPLSPGHFLIGRPLTSIPGPNYENCSTSHLNRFERIEQIRQHFWARWSKEYISELQQRVKWRSNNASLKLNSLVVLKDDALPPLKWKLGRIVAVHPGSDGINRVADIKTMNGVVRRAFSKICPLPEVDASG